MNGITRLVLIDPKGVERGLERVRAAKVLPEESVPNTWQVTLGVLRMWQRVVYRNHEIGSGGGIPPRKTWRAKVLARKPLRFPFLVAERAIAPLDFSGLLSSRERIIHHLLSAHHDGDEFVYDFELLRLHDGALEEVARRAREVATSDSPRAVWLRDLCVFEGYHARLAEAAEREIAKVPSRAAPENPDPDGSFFGYLAWCATQPATLRETIAAKIGLAS
ncbi:MAG: hypothetical protein U0174_25725 [Polyangiaceae bacterium]